MKTSRKRNGLVWTPGRATAPSGARGEGPRGGRVQALFQISDQCQHGAILVFVYICCYLFILVEYFVDTRYYVLLCFTACYHAFLLSYYFLLRFTKCSLLVHTCYMFRYLFGRKLEKVHEGSRKLEKVGEGWGRQGGQRKSRNFERMQENVGESSRKLQENVGRSMNKYDQLRNVQEKVESGVDPGAAPLGPAGRVPEEVESEPFFLCPTSTSMAQFYYLFTILYYLFILVQYFVATRYCVLQRFYYLLPLVLTFLLLFTTCYYVLTKMYYFVYVSLSLQRKLEKVHEGSRKFEKIGEGWRRQGGQRKSRKLETK